MVTLVDISIVSQPSILMEMRDGGAWGRGCEAAGRASWGWHEKRAWVSPGRFVIRAHR